MFIYILYYFGLVFDIIFIILLILGFFIKLRRERNIKNKKISENTRICFYCDNHYSPCKGELPFLYCPYCGEKTFKFDNESFEVGIAIDPEVIEILRTVESELSATEPKEDEE